MIQNRKKKIKPRHWQRGRLRSQRITKAKQALFGPKNVEASGERTVRSQECGALQSRERCPKKRTKQPLYDENKEAAQVRPTWFPSVVSVLMFSAYVWLRFLQFRNRPFGRRNVKTFHRTFHRTLSYSHSLASSQRDKHKNKHLVYSRLQTSNPEEASNPKKGNWLRTPKSVDQFYVFKNKCQYLSLGPG